MKVIKLIENRTNGTHTEKIMCSNIVYNKLHITGHLTYGIDLWDEFKGRAKNGLEFN